MSTVSTNQLATRLSEFVRRFDDRLAGFVSHDMDAPELLGDAMRYALLGEGKRIRPYLVVRCSELLGGGFDEALPAAAAVEMVHAFSLVHDDLPAMDDDDIRRGRPTCHKKFGDAMAILAGDALLTLAFETLSRHVSDPARAVVLTRELAAATGYRGMIGGQADDILGERQPPGLERVREIHLRKTAALFAASARMGALTVDSDSASLEELGEYGYHVGLAFQIADDLLDVAGEAEPSMAAGRQNPAGDKQTYPASVGIQKSRQLADAAVAAALSALSRFGEQADDLRALAGFAGRRDR